MPVIIPDILLDLLGGRDKAENDYRPVPASDTGETYTDQGQLGGYSPSLKPYAPPEDVRWFAGYGATEEDLKRGWSEPRITENPAYDLANYKDRWSDPLHPDVRYGDTDAVPSDIQFRQRNRQSRGLVTRPRIPKERN